MFDARELPAASAWELWRLSEILPPRAPPCWWAVLGSPNETLRLRLLPSACKACTHGCRQQAERRMVNGQNLSWGLFTRPALAGTAQKAAASSWCARSGHLWHLQVPASHAGW